MQKQASCVAVCLALFATVRLSAQTAKPTQIYFIDTEGGQSTLVVDPQGESLLIDTGFATPDNRDANRIMVAARNAGLHQIDVLAITHYHSDHVGGAPALAKMIKIGTFVDHGDLREITDANRQPYAAYQSAIGSAHHIVAHPGDHLPFKGMNVEILAADGKIITAPLVGAGQPNPLCASAPAPATDTSENAYSLGMIVTIGRFRFLDLGDFTGELSLACPNNLIGTVDLYISTHHATDGSNPAALVDAIHPHVVVINNGANKGGASGPWQNLHDIPGLAALWQLHFSVGGGQDHNVPETNIANMTDDPTGDGNYIKVTVNSVGAMTVTNSRNNFQKTYR